MAIGERESSESICVVLRDGRQSFSMHVHLSFSYTPTALMRLHTVSYIVYHQMNGKSKKLRCRANGQKRHLGEGNIKRAGVEVLLTQPTRYARDILGSGSLASCGCEEEGCGSLRAQSGKGLGGLFTQSILLPLPVIKITQCFGSAHHCYSDATCCLSHGN